jgi:translation initiation factor 1 (eIF-1/SUI1)
MSLIAKLNLLLSREKEDNTIILPAETNRKSFDHMMSLNNTRAAVINDSRKMFEEDSRVKNALYRVASDMVAGSFSINVESGPYKAKAQDEANKVLERLNLRSSNGKAGSFLTQSIVHAMRDGDLFLQIGASEEEGINKIVKMPLMSNDVSGYTSYSPNAYPVMYRNSNAIDDFDDPKKAYFLSQFPLGNTFSDNSGTWFREWQILHIRWYHEPPKKYGIPLLSSARISYKMLREGETDVAIRRKTRAGQKRHHKITGADSNIIEQYKAWNADALKDATAAASDYFSNERTEIISMQGDEQIGVIDDILHHLETLGIGIIVPLAMTGYGRNVNRDVLDVQDKEYRRLLESLGSFPVESIIKPIIETQWLLSGINPKKYRWSIEWSSKESWQLNADGLFKLHGLVSPEYWTSMASKILPNFDPSKELEYILQHYYSKASANSVKGANQNEPGRNSIT